MARTNNLKNYLTDVAEAIREKTNTTEQINANEFDTKINEISANVDINGLIKQYEVEVGGSVSLGDFVTFMNDKITIGKDEIINGMNNLYSMESVKLSKNKYFITYVINDTDKNQYATILTLENGKIKIENSTWINNQVSYNIQLVKLTETKILMLMSGKGFTDGRIIELNEDSISVRNDRKHK